MLLTATYMEQLVRAIVKGIQQKKGHDIVVADLGGIEGAICNYFVIATGNSPAQVEAITDAVEETARMEQGEKPVHTIGLQAAHWVAMDYTDVLVHIFLPEEREFYNLEGLWDDAAIEHIKDEA